MHRTVDRLPRLPAVGESNTILEDDRHFREMKIAHNLTDTLMCMADKNKDKVVLLIADQTKTINFTRTTENKILVERALDTYCKTEQLQVGGKDSTSTLIYADL